MGSAEIITILPIIILLPGIIYGVMWSSKKSKNSAFDIPMVWYYFYTYVLLPLVTMSVLVQLGILIKTIETANSNMGLGFVIFLIGIIIGLSKFKIWGWWINLVLMTIVFFSLILPGTLYLLLLALLWFIPNIMYFYKRKKLFS